MPTEKEMARQKEQWGKLPYSEKKKLIKMGEEIGYLKKQNQVPVGDWRGFGLSGLFFIIQRTGIKGLRATKKKCKVML